MPVINHLQEKLRKGLQASYKDAYAEAADTWKKLEDKAQANIAIAGVLVAAIVAFVEKMTLRFPTLQGMLLAIAIFFLLLSVVYAVLVLKIQHTHAPPYGDFTGKTVLRMLDLTDESTLKEAMKAHDMDVIRAWETVTAKTQKIVREKAQRVWDSQLFLIASIATGGIVAVIQLFIKACDAGAGR